MSISIKNLEIGYAPCRLARCEDIDFASGRIVPLIGDNGAGKSTFLKTLAGLIPALSGEVKYSGQKINDISASELARFRSILLTERPSFQWLIVEDILKWSSDGRSLKVYEEFIEDFQVQNLLSRDFASLSDGQKQRVMICRSFIQDTPIVLLDEPTVFLDINMKKYILDKLIDLAKSKNKLILACTHEWEWVLRKNLKSLYLNPKDEKLQFIYPEKLVELGVYSKN